MPDATRRRTLQVFIDSALSFALIVAGVSVIYLAWSKSRASTVPPPTTPLSLIGAHLKGNIDAPVAIMVFSDFSCPYCRIFATEILPKIERQYIDTGQVLLAFRHYPIAAIHPLAVDAADIAECAGDQGAFWQMHDALFSQPRPSRRSDLFMIGRRIGVNISLLRECLSTSARTRIGADISIGREIGVHSTPVFLIGTLANRHLIATHVIGGAQPFNTFTEAIDDALGEHQSVLDRYARYIIGILRCTLVLSTVPAQSI